VNKSKTDKRGWFKIHLQIDHLRFFGNDFAIQMPAVIAISMAAGIPAKNIINPTPAIVSLL
jgi:hypothetical protein